jgi:hypothetical protein
MLTKTTPGHPPLKISFGEIKINSSPKTNPSFLVEIVFAFGVAIVKKIGHQGTQVTLVITVKKSKL